MGRGLQVVAPPFFVSIAFASMATASEQFPNRRIAIGRTPDFVNLADLDHDNDLDAVTVNNATADVTVLLSDGAGEFTPSGNFACGSGALGIELVLFDSDNHVDALIPRGSAARVTLLRGDGQGGFLPAIDIPTPSAFSSFAAGDIDADGDRDLVVASGGALPSTLISLLSNGVGGFQVRSSAIPNGVKYLALGEATGDGVLDVLGVVDDSTNNVTTFRGDGAGLFQKISSVALPGTVSDALVAGDFDSDGDADVATVFHTLPGGHEWFGVATNDGLGNFVSTANVDSTFYSSVGRAEAADVDGDGALDLVFYHSYFNGAWFAGSGHATFAPAKWLPSAGRGVVVDVDQDARPEIVSLSSDPQSSFGVARWNAFGEFDGGSGGATGGHFEATDFDSDGDLDLIGATFLDAVAWSRNDVLGHFSPAPILPTPSTAHELVRGLRVADFDNDGHDDVLLWKETYAPAYVGLADGQGGIAAWKTTPLPSGTNVWSHFGEVGDFNQDGTVDFAVGMQYGIQPGKVGVDVRPGAGDGTFGAVAASPTFGYASWSYDVRPFIANDFDQDGRTDLIAADSATQGSSPVLNFSITRCIGPFTFAPIASTPIGVGRAMLVTAGDIDGDGYQDVAVKLASTSSGDWVIAARGNGMGGISTTMSLGPPVELEISRIALDDLDRDGRSDLITSYSNSRVFGVFHGQSNFSLAPRQSFLAGVYESEVRIADVDGDGTKDLIAAGAVVLRQNQPVSPCSGSFVKYGTGCYGDSYFVPKLTGGGCPTPGGLMSIQIQQAPGAPLANFALLFLGAQASSLFIGPGCQLLTFPILAGPLALPLHGNGAGGGGISAYVPLAPSLTSGSVFLQAFVPHSTVAWGFASTNGLRIDIQ